MAVSIRKGGVDHRNGGSLAGLVEQAHKVGVRQVVDEGDHLAGHSRKSGGKTACRMGRPSKASWGFAGRTREASPFEKISRRRPSKIASANATGEACPHCAERGPGRPGSGAFRKGPGSQAQCHHNLGIDLGGGEQVRHPDLSSGPWRLETNPGMLGPKATPPGMSWT